MTDELFTCPRCGGHHFGTHAAKLTYTIELYECHNMTNGQPPDGGPKRMPDGRLTYRSDSFPPCRWTGPREECISIHEIT